MDSQGSENQGGHQVTAYHWGVAVLFSVGVYMGWKFGMQLFS